MRLKKFLGISLLLLSCNSGTADNDHEIMHEIIPKTDVRLNKKENIKQEIVISDKEELPVAPYPKPPQKPVKKKQRKKLLKKSYHKPKSAKKRKKLKSKIQEMEKEINNFEQQIDKF